MSAGHDALTPGQKCPMSGRVISFPNGDEWVNEEGTCFRCGGKTRLRVRATDLFPRARCLTHKVPKKSAPARDEGVLLVTTHGHLRHRDDDEGRPMSAYLIHWTSTRSADLASCPTGTTAIMSTDRVANMRELTEYLLNLPGDGSFTVRAVSAL